MYFEGLICAANAEFGLKDFFEIIFTTQLGEFMSNDELNGLDFKVDTSNLYKEEGYTDLKVASVRRLVPVDADGNEDPSRAAIYVGTTQLMTPQGLLPIQGALPANNFKEALEAFPEAMRKATEQMIAEAQKMKEKEESRIIVPGRE